MVEITTLFWDVGGVILTNGWDRAARERAAAEFGLNLEDLEDRHRVADQLFETGQMTLDEYLERTVFYCARSFSKERFKEFMFAQSRDLPESHGVVGELAKSMKYLMATLNNESLELNEHRIQEFGLREHFTLFFSSCYIHVRKPDAAIFHLALQVTQRRPQECLFIDDRPRNLEYPRRLGMCTIQFQNAAQLRAELGRQGVMLAAS